MKQRFWWIASMAIAFAVGVGCGAAYFSGTALAQQRFGPGEVRSVPQDFIDSANKEYLVLLEIRAVLDEHQRHLANIEASTANTVTQLQGLRQQTAAPAR